MEDGQNILRPVLDNHPYYGFKPIRTLWIAYFEAALTLTLEVATFILAYIWTNDDIVCDVFYSIVYAHVCLWSIYFILDHCLKWQHLRLRKEGYLEFHDICNKYATLPFYITSFWNGILLVTLTVYSEMETSAYYFCDKSYFTSPVNFAVFLITVENVLLLPVITYYIDILLPIEWFPHFAIYACENFYLFIKLISYMESVLCAVIFYFIVRVHDFNKNRRSPDAEQDNRWMPTILRESISSGEVGYRERCEAIDNMLEKQADLIRYYKEANEQLNRKVMELSSQCRVTSINA